MEAWGSAAETLAALAVLQVPAEPVSFKVEVEGYDVPASFPEPGVGIVLYDATPAVFTVEIPEEDTWEVGVMAYSTAGDGASVTMTLRVDGATEGAWAVYKNPATASALTVEVPLTAGTHEIAVTMTNPTPADPDLPIPEQDWSSAHLLHLDWFSFTATTLFEEAVDNGSKVLTCDPDESDVATCGAEILEGFASRAWRRPLAEQETTDLLVFIQSAVDDGRGFKRGVQVALEAILLSPHFLFLVEPPGADPEDMELTDHEIATRLSYFLWNSMPDEVLFAAADEGVLHDPTEIATQVARMLDDPRSEGLVHNLADQWLMGRIMKHVNPSPDHFPDFDEDLRAAMMEEVHLFLGSFVANNRPIRELLDSIDLYVNNRLRQHYDLPPGIEEFEHLIVHSTERGGLLAQGGILTALSPPTRTSPTRRGKWVLERLLCETVDPPPPGVTDSFQTGMEGMEIQEMLALHVADPACAGCHQVMDPLGFGLGAFDGIGAWRDTFDGEPINTAGVLPGDIAFDGVREMSGVIADDPRFAPCVAETVYTWAMARVPISLDQETLAHIQQDWSQGEMGFRDLLMAIATSEGFRRRLPPGDPPEPEDDGEGSP